MIRVLMFDLGGTLVDDQLKPLPHVPDALAAIAALRCADGKPLRSCLVSDYTMAPPQATVAQVRALFREYLAQLDQTGLRTWFEPVARRITLSTHAGRRKPAAAVFSKALARLQSKATLAECLLITENAAHAAAVRQKLGMQALLYGGAGTPAADFCDWRQAPALVAARLGLAAEAEPHQRVRDRLLALGVEPETIETAAAGRLRIRGRVWQPLAVPGHPELDGLCVAVPVDGECGPGPEGDAELVKLAQPGAKELAETTAFVHQLAEQGQIAGPAKGGAARGPSRGSLPGQASHAVETDAQGRRRLVRKRFSAF
jgi:beta-phosphoglucomutase-like phosphatase (HAD superfamily)